ncbi:MAG: nucleotidyltransferase domain-containing protein [Clostridiales bacterium]|nr:nucleotidyltransferase domain-containing protein [Clostridiales bacterium]
MNFGIPTKSMDMIIHALKRNNEIEQAAFFGSRAMGNFKKGSDIDIAIYGENITMEMLNQLSVELNEKLPLPYYFDIVHYESLTHQELKNHIDAYGKVFYKK